MGDALGNFLPGCGFLGVQKFGEVVDDHHKPRVVAARPQRADRHRGVQHAARQRNLDVLRCCAHAPGAPHQSFHHGRRRRSHQVRHRSRAASRLPEDSHHRGVNAIHRAAFVHGENPGGNIFQNCFHQPAPLFDFIDCVLQAAIEILNLFAALGELRGHLVERVHQRTQLVLRLHRHPVIEVPLRNLPRRFGQRSDRHGNLLREIKRGPGN